MFNPRESVLVIGLGNYTSEYDHTRHNVGFDCLDIIRDFLEKESNTTKDEFYFNKESNYLISKFKKTQNKIIYLMKPLTFMNLSGDAMSIFLKKNAISYENIIVIRDDMDLSVGVTKAKISTSDAGHRGIRSINENFLKLNSNVLPKYIQVKVGIGHPQDHDVIKHVLSKFNEDEQESIDKGILTACELTLSIISRGYEKGIEFINARNNRLNKEKKLEEKKTNRE